MFPACRYPPVNYDNSEYCSSALLSSTSLSNIDPSFFCFAPVSCDYHVINFGYFVHIFISFFLFGGKSSSFTHVFVYIPFLQCSSIIKSAQPFTKMSSVTCEVNNTVCRCNWNPAVFVTGDSTSGRKRRAKHSNGTDLEETSCSPSDNSQISTKCKQFEENDVWDWRSDLLSNLKSFVKCNKGCFLLCAGKMSVLLFLIEQLHCISKQNHKLIFYFSVDKMLHHYYLIKKH